ncbi:CD36 family-domain-containing protein [Scenedesmus sp. NREL 46B-D3]|nr:CD36 family-domain-containing protein [Scenedesmus sp. NREL 46B-D3]
MRHLWPLLRCFFCLGCCHPAARYRNNTAPGAPPAYFRAWLFNITNLHDVRQGAKPMLDYTYFKLDRNLTAADPDASIATFNMPLLGVLAALHGNVSPRLVPFVDLLLHVLASYQEEGLHGLFAVRSATELLWGYEDKLLKLLENLVPAGTLPNGALVALLQNASSLNAALAKNASIYNTGELDISRLWNVEADQGRTEVKSWPCAEPVRGGDATQFRPSLTADDRLTVWVGDVYQAADLIVNKSTELHGVKLLRFWLDPAQAEPNPCHNQELRGLMNITGPQSAGWDGPANASGPAAFVSMPMFCGADDRLLQQVEGLQCDWERHMTWVDVEPTTGITLRAFKRMMMSSRIGDLGSVLEPNVAPNLTIPIFWAEESGEVTQDLAQQFRSSLYSAFTGPHCVNTFRLTRWMHCRRRAQWMVANLSKSWQCSWLRIQTSGRLWRLMSPRWQQPGVCCTLGKRAGGNQRPGGSVVHSKGVPLHLELVVQQQPLSAHQHASSSPKAAAAALRSSLAGPKEPVLPEPDLLDSALSSGPESRVDANGNTQQPQLSKEELEQVVRGVVDAALEATMSKFVRSLRTVLEDMGRRIETTGAATSTLKDSLEALREQIDAQAGNVHARFTSVDLAVKEVERAGPAAWPAVPCSRWRVPCAVQDGLGPGRSAPTRWPPPGRASGGPQGPGGPAIQQVSLDKVVSDIVAMGFSHGQVMGVVRQLQSSGHALEMNVIIDRLMAGGR